MATTDDKTKIDKQEKTNISNDASNGSSGETSSDNTKLANEDEPSKTKKGSSGPEEKDFTD
jgi:hypothetical protein